MKIFVSTNLTQGDRKNDFCCTEGDEPVFFGSECTNERIDGHCGCKRSMAGVFSLRHTSTFTVVESSLTRPQYEYMLQETFRKAGFLKDGEEEEWKQSVSIQADILLDAANSFSEGVILERRGSKIQIRIMGARGIPLILSALMKSLRQKKSALPKNKNFALV